MPGAGGAATGARGLAEARAAAAGHRRSADRCAVERDLDAACRQPGDPLLHQQPVVVDEPATLGEGGRPLGAIDGEPLDGRRTGVAVGDLLELPDGIGSVISTGSACHGSGR